MNFESTPTRQEMVLKIPYDLISTKIESLSKVKDLIKNAYAENKNYQILLIDLKNCSMIDSAGLNFLVSLHKLVSSKGGKVTAINLGKNVRRTFLFSRLDRYIEISEN